MAIIANKRSVMTLFSSADDMFSHQVRIVLAEKGVTVDILQVTPDNVPEDLYEVNPYVTLPTLLDRELALYQSNIIMEYLDERFPHPPLMPVYPVARGQARLMMYRMEKDWYRLADSILAGDENAVTAKQELKEGLLSIAPLFNEAPFFMSEEFGLVDCYMAALLWRLPALGIELTGPGSKELKNYMTRIFEREAFQMSLTDAEREIRKGIKL